MHQRSGMKDGVEGEEDGSESTKIDIETSKQKHLGHDSSDPVIAENRFFSLDKEKRKIFVDLHKKAYPIKLKALFEIKRRSRDSHEFSVQILGPWLQTLKKLVYHPSDKIRENAAIIQLQLAQVAKRSFLEYLDDIICYWLCAQFDPNPLVASIFANSLKETFPRKMNKMYDIYKSVIVSHLRNRISTKPIYSTTVSFSKSNGALPEFEETDPEDIRISGALSLMTHILEQERIEDMSAMEPILSYEGLWDSRKYTSQIARTSWNQFIVAASKAIPDALGERLKAVPIEFLTPILSTGRLQNHIVNWKTMTAITSVAPELWERTTDLHDSLLSQISSGIFADPAVVYSCLCDLLEKMPNSLVANRDFRLKLVSAVWNGFSNLLPYYMSGRNFLKLYLSIIIDGGIRENLLFYMDAIFKPIKLLLLTNTFPKPFSCIKDSDIHMYISELLSTFKGDEELVRRELVGSLIKLGNEVLDSDNLDVANFENRNRKIPSALRSLLDLLKSPEDVRSICDMFEDVYFGVASWSIAHPDSCYFRFLNCGLWILEMRPEVIAKHVEELNTFLGIHMDWEEPSSDYLKTVIGTALLAPSDCHGIKSSCWNKIADAINSSPLSVEICDALCFSLEASQNGSCNIESIDVEKFSQCVQPIVDGFEDTSSALFERTCNLFLKYLTEESPLQESKLFNAIMSSIAYKISNFDRSAKSEATFYTHVKLFLNTLSLISVERLRTCIDIFSLTLENMILHFFSYIDVTNVSADNECDVWKELEKVRYENSSAFNALMSNSIKTIVGFILNPEFGPSLVLNLINCITYLVQDEGEFSRCIVTSAVGDKRLSWQIPGDTISMILYIQNGSERDIIFEDHASDFFSLHLTKYNCHEYLFRYLLVTKLAGITYCHEHILEYSWLGTELARANLVLNKIKLEDDTDYSPEYVELLKRTLSHACDTFLLHTEIADVHEDIIMSIIDGSFSPLSETSLYHLPNMLAYSIFGISEGVGGYSEVLLHALRSLFKLDNDYTYADRKTIVNSIREIMDREISVCRHGCVHRQKVGLCYNLAKTAKLDTQALDTILNAVTSCLKKFKIGEREKYYYFEFVDKVINTHCKTATIESDLVCPNLHTLAKLIHSSWKVSQSVDKRNSCSDVDPLLDAKTFGLVNTARKLGWNVDYMTHNYLSSKLDIVLKDSRYSEGHLNILLLRECLEFLFFPKRSDSEYNSSIASDDVELHEMLVIDILSLFSNTYGHDCRLIPKAVRDIDGLIAEYISSIEFPNSSLSSDDTSSILRKVETAICSRLYHSKLACFEIMSKLVTKAVKDLSIPLQVLLEELGSADKAFDADKTFSPIDMKKSLLPKLSGIERQISNTEDQTRRDSMDLSYFMLWAIIIYHIQYSTPALRLYYLSTIIKYGSIDTLMSVISRYLGAFEKSLDSNVSRTSYKIGSNLDIKILEKKGKVEVLTTFATYVYYLVTAHAPGLVATWYESSKGASWARGIKNFTFKFVSPELFKRTTRLLNEKKGQHGYENIEISDNKAFGKISAKFDIDNCDIILNFEIPPYYPLHRISVSTNYPEKRSNAYGRKFQKPTSFHSSKYSNDKSCTAMLSNVEKIVRINNGRVDDALAYFARDIKSYTEGIKPCSICFSVIDSPYLSIPQKVCRTCSSGFHTNCLSEWFRTSNNSNCPICRQPF